VKHTCRSAWIGTSSPLCSVLAEVDGPRPPKSLFENRNYPLLRWSTAGSLFRRFVAWVCSSLCALCLAPSRSTLNGRVMGRQRVLQKPWRTVIVPGQACVVHSGMHTALPDESHVEGRVMC